MKFLKYCEKWAHGHSDWKFKLLSMDNEVDENWLEEVLSDINSDHNWSDKYRGIDYEVVDYPGHEWMTKNIKSCKRKIKNTEVLLGEYNALYYKNGGT